jgi:ribonuclease Z
VHQNQTTTSTTDTTTSRRRLDRPRSALAAAALLIAGALAAGTSSCSDSSRASESEPLCIDGALPLGERTPLIDAVCSEPPSALSAAAEQQQRANAEAAAASAAELQRRDAITIVTCGTGTPIPSDRVQACTAVFVNGLFLLFDAGDGAERSMERSLLPMPEVDAIFLTHFHSDHVADVGEVISRSWILGRTAPLPVYGGEAVQRVVDGFNAVYALDDNYRQAHHGEDILNAHVEPAVPHTIDDPGAAGRVVFERDGVTVTAFRVNHPPIEPALGYRIDYAGRSVVISGDTTDTASLRAMSEGADVLVSEVMSRDVLEAVECALKRLDDPRNARLIRDIRTYHIGTTELAGLAQNAGVRTLVLTHQVPSFDNDDPRVELLLAAPVRAIYSGELIAARDGQRIVLRLD